MIEIVEKLKDMDLKEILGYAIGSEEAAKEYYTSLAERIAHELAATKFKNIAREEETHKKVLLSLYKKRVGNEKYTVPSNLPPLEGSVDVDNVTSLIHALEIAMQNEYRAYRVYQYLSDTQKEYKDMFTYLANAEKGHHEILNLEKESYERPVMGDPSLLHEKPDEVWKTFILPW